MSESATVVVLQHPPHGSASVLHIHTRNLGVELPNLVRDVLLDRSLWLNEPALAAFLCAQMVRADGNVSLTSYPIPVDYPWLIIDAASGTVASQRPEADRPLQTYTFEEFLLVQDWTQLGLDQADQVDD